MTNNDTSAILEELSKVAIAGLKKAVADGKKTTGDTLLSIFKDMPEAHAFIEKFKEGPGKKTSKDELEVLKNQKEKLVRQLDGLEEQFDRNERMSKRIMVFFAEWMRPFAGETLDASLKKTP